MSASRTLPVQHVSILKKRGLQKQVVGDKSEYLWDQLENTQGLLRSYAADLFSRVSPELEPQVFMLGVLKEQENNLPLIHVQPEDCGVDVELFKDASVLAKSILESDPRHKLADDDRFSRYDFYRDAERDSIKHAVEQLVEQNFQGKNVVSFVSIPVSLESYEILAVLQFNKHGCDSFDSVFQNADTCVSFLDSLVQTFFNEILAQLHGIRTPMNSALTASAMNEVMRIATATFIGRTIQVMCNPASDPPDYYVNPFDLFNTCEYISALNYEGGASAGKIIVGDKNNSNFDMRLELATPIGLSEHKKVRKLLETTSRGLALYTDGHKILGLAEHKNDHAGNSQSFLSINFAGLHKWELIHGSKKLLVVEYGIPRRFKPEINRGVFDDLLHRTFDGATQDILDRLWMIVNTAVEQKRGALLIISSDAESEAERLSKQSTKIKPTMLNKQLVESVTSIDGAVLLDIAGICYAIGVILDGKAVSEGTSERGARYNSAVRYVENNSGKCVAIIISEDGMVNLYPVLKPRIQRGEIAKHIEDLRLIPNAGVSGDSKFYAAMHWLVEHAFYLSLEQSNEITRLESKWYRKSYRDTSIPSAFKDFRPNSKMNDSYFID